MSEIFNCGEAKQKEELVRFEYQCPKQWQELQETQNDSVRFCDLCQENVFYCTDKKEADIHARQGNCIAIDPQLSSDVYNQYTPMTLGRPKTNSYWANDIFDRAKHWLVEVIQSQEMKAIDLNHSNLSHVDLSGADLSHANLSYANLTNTNLSHANLSYANLSQANLKRANLKGANLNGANLNKANLSNADFSYANLSGVDLSKILNDVFAGISCIQLRSINLDGAILDPKYQAAYLNYKGKVCRNWKNKQQALEYFQQALLISREAGDYSEEAEAIDGLAQLHQEKGEKQQALELYHQALSIKKELGDRHGEAKMLNRLGNFHLKEEQKIQALDYFQQALAISEQFNNLQEIISNLQPAIDICEGLDNNQYLLLEYYQKYLSVRPEDIKILNKLGNLCLNLDEKEQALDYFQQRASLLEKSINPQERIYQGAKIYILKTIIEISERIGYRHNLIIYYRQLLSLRRIIADYPEEVQSFRQLQLSQISIEQGDRSDIEYFQDLLTYRRQIGDPPGEAQNLIDLGILYCKQGENRSAIQYFQQALTTIRQLKQQANKRDKFDKSEALNSEKKRILEMLDSIAHRNLNLTEYCQTLLRNRENNRQEEIKILSKIADVYRSLGELDQALDYYHKALLCIQKEYISQATIFRLMGRVDRDTEKPEQAIELYHQALLIMQELGNLPQLKAKLRQAIETIIHLANKNKIN